MDNQTLRALLIQLDEEIKNTQPVDETGAELLTNLREDVESLLDHPQVFQFKHHPTFTNSLEKTLNHFEVTHPTLSGQISHLLDFLSNAGI
jgi:hypothetical protein